MGDENPIRTLGDYSKPSHEGYRNTIKLPVGNNVAPLRSDIIRLVQNGCSFHELRSEDPNQHLKDFLKLVDSLDLDGDNRERTRRYVPSTSDRRLIELENQVQCLMEAYLALTQPTQVNKITTSCEICSGPHDTQYCMENPEQASVEYASSHTDEAGVLKFNSLFESLGLVPPSPNAELVCTKEEDGDMMFIEIIPKDDNPHKDEPEARVQEVEYFDILPTRSELAKGASPKTAYLRNDEDKRRGVEYVMSKIIGFYKECLELGPEYLRRMDDEG
ncbi:hypothetical protein Tco_0200774 [Tanacetum coccineum]